jgi:hypothetical protein
MIGPVLPPVKGIQTGGGGFIFLATPFSQPVLERSRSPLGLAATRPHPHNTLLHYVNAFAYELYSRLYPTRVAIAMSPYLPGLSYVITFVHSAKVSSPPDGCINPPYQKALANQSIPSNVWLWLIEYFFTIGLTPCHKKENYWLALAFLY